MHKINKCMCIVQDEVLQCLQVLSFVLYRVCLTNAGTGILLHVQFCPDGIVGPWWDEDVLEEEYRFKETKLSMVDLQVALNIPLMHTPVVAVATVIKLNWAQEARCWKHTHTVDISQLNQDWPFAASFHLLRTYACCLEKKTFHALFNAVPPCRTVLLGCMICMQCIDAACCYRCHRLMCLLITCSRWMHLLLLGVTR